jgi:hypothetical protein
MLEGRNNGSWFDWALTFVAPSQQNSSDDDKGDNLYKCQNCRYDPRDASVFIGAFLYHACSYSQPLDSS